MLLGWSLAMLFMSIVLFSVFVLKEFPQLKKKKACTEEVETPVVVYRVESTDEEIGHGHYNFLNSEYTKGDLPSLFEEQLHGSYDESAALNFAVEKLEFNNWLEFLEYINKNCLNKNGQNFYML